jgi:hypothetical protein
MTQSEPSSEFAVQDISVDREGRVSVTNPRIGARLQTAMAVKKPKPKPNGNCGCNTSPGCNGPDNPPDLICQPQNTVTNCGCHIA